MCVKPTVCLFISYTDICREIGLYTPVMQYLRKRALRRLNDVGSLGVGNFTVHDTETNVPMLDEVYNSPLPKHTRSLPEDYIHMNQGNRPSKDNSKLFYPPNKIINEPEPEVMVANTESGKRDTDKDDSMCLLPLATTPRTSTLPKDLFGPRLDDITDPMQCRKPSDSLSVHPHSFTLEDDEDIDDDNPEGNISAEDTDRSSDEDSVNLGNIGAGMDFEIILPGVSHPDCIPEQKLSHLTTKFANNCRRFNSELSMLHKELSLFHERIVSSGSLAQRLVQNLTTKPKPIRFLTQ